MYPGSRRTHGEEKAAIRGLSRSVPTVVAAAGPLLLDGGQLVLHVGDLELDRQTRQQGYLVRSQLGHCPGFVADHGAGDEFEDLADLYGSAPQAGKADNFLFPRCKF